MYPNKLKDIFGPLKQKITCCISDMLSIDEVRENIININRETTIFSFYNFSINSNVISFEY